MRAGSRLSDPDSQDYLQFERVVSRSAPRCLRLVRQPIGPKYGARQAWRCISQPNYSEHCRVHGRNETSASDAGPPVHSGLDLEAVLVSAKMEYTSQCFWQCPPDGAVLGVWG
jgi:hypothetical protein